MSSTPPAIIEPARKFIDATASLLEGEGYVLREELVPLINMYSVTRSTVVKDGYSMECWWHDARDASAWEHQVELILYRDNAPITTRRIAAKKGVTSPAEVIEFLHKYRPDK